MPRVDYASLQPCCSLWLFVQLELYSALSLNYALVMINQLGRVRQYAIIRHGVESSFLWQCSPFCITMIGETTSLTRLPITCFTILFMQISQSSTWSTRPVML